MTVVTTVVAGLGVLLAATVVFDVVHVTLHRLQNARAPWLQAIGAWHAVHHRFLGPDLAVDEGLIGANLRWHVVPEYVTHVVVTTGLLLVVPPGPIAIALALETLVFGIIVRDRGLDVNHRARLQVPAYRPSFVCMPAYHALHHARPTGFYSSWIKVVDMMLGTTAVLRGCSATIVGEQTDLGAAMGRAVAAETGSEVPCISPSVEAVRSAAATTDLLVLSPSTGSPGETVSAWIEAAILASPGRLVPIEVWAVLPDGAVFVAEGRGYVDDARVIYRHIVVPRPLAGDPRQVARGIVARIRRGAHRVHMGPMRQRLRDWLVAWCFVRPTRRGPRAAALA